MTNSDSDGLFDNDWEDRGELSWTEAEWVKYLNAQEEAVQEYLKHYEQLTLVTDRIDEVARRMGWELAALTETALEESADEADEEFDDDWVPYTLHRNPVYISTRALYLSLTTQWEKTVTTATDVPAALALAVQASLYRGNEHVVQAVEALEMGDYTLAICLFKRALSEINASLARLSQPDVLAHQSTTEYRTFALPRLFDLREIWLRVMGECRQNRREDLSDLE